MKEEQSKRKRLRIDFEASVNLFFDAPERTLRANMKNISMKGIFVETDAAIPVGSPCRVEIVISGKNSRLIMETEGIVCRHDPHGFGIQFINQMEWLALFSIFEPYGRTRK